VLYYGPYEMLGMIFYQCKTDFFHVGYPVATHLTPPLVQDAAQHPGREEWQSRPSANLTGHCLQTRVRGLYATIYEEVLLTHRDYVGSTAGSICTWVSKWISSTTMQFNGSGHFSVATYV
jgi:hypothetical protein